MEFVSDHLKQSVLCCLATVEHPLAGDVVDAITSGLELAIQDRSYSLFIFQCIHIERPICLLISRFLSTP